MDSRFLTESINAEDARRSRRRAFRRLTNGARPPGRVGQINPLLEQSKQDAPTQRSDGSDNVAIFSRTSTASAALPIIW
jgi:hypothetical protein